MNWSGGKDALFALHQLQNDPEFEVKCLLTTVNEANNRVSMHGVPLALMEKQAESLGIPLEPVFLAPNISLDNYNQLMEKKLNELKSRGFTHSVFGDILLDDLREHREKQLDKIGIKAAFPLWKRNTRDIVEDFIKTGYKALVVVVNDKVLDRSFCGRVLDQAFLKDLPDEVDPCGENGEFHSFVYDGPLFDHPVLFKKEGVVEKSYTPSAKEEEKDCYKAETQDWDIKFWFADLQKL